MANLVTFAKKLWKDKVGGNTPITAAELNRIESGVNDCATQINKLGDSVSQTVTVEASSIKKARLYNADDSELQQYFAIHVVSPKGGSKILIFAHDGIILYDDNTKTDVWRIEGTTTLSDPSMPNGELS